MTPKIIPTVPYRQVSDFWERRHDDLELELERWCAYWRLARVVESSGCHKQKQNDDEQYNTTNDQEFHVNNGI